jgi:hypothetical protein
VEAVAEVAERLLGRHLATELVELVQLEVELVSAELPARQLLAGGSFRTST